MQLLQQWMRENSRMSQMGNELRKKIADLRAKAQVAHKQADDATRKSLNFPVGSDHRERWEAAAAEHRMKAKDCDHAANMYQGTLDTLGE